MRAHDQQRTFRLTIAAAATARNIRLIAETINASHMGIAYHVEHNFWRHAATPGLQSIDKCWVCVWNVKHYPWAQFYKRIVLGKMFEGHCLPNRVTARTSHKNLCNSTKFPILSQPSNLNYELEIVHNCLDTANTNLMYHCKYISKFVLLLRKAAVVS